MIPCHDGDDDDDGCYLWKEDSDDGGEHFKPDCKKISSDRKELV
jgi:hypothetical protein